MINQKSKIKNQKYKLKLKDFKKRKDFFIKKIVAAEIGFHELPEEMTAYERVEIRRRAMEKITGARLSHVGKFSFDAEDVSSRNCENLIGGIQIPLGIAGPVKINGRFCNGEFYLPLSATEGALVASINRGCKAINLSGGVRVEAVSIGMTRAPVFIIKSKIKNQKSKIKEFIFWIERNFGEIAKVCEETSRHLKLLKIEPFIDEGAVHGLCPEDDAVFLRFSFDTGLAMGMNMATIATSKASSFIEKETGAKLIALSSNVCVDKKVSQLNFEKGRGKQVKAKVKLTNRVIEEVLKTTSKDFYEVYRLKIVKGSEIARTIGRNAQIANVIAAIFAATGQDLGHIGEASVGVTSCELDKSGLLISVFLPDLPIGVVGGGTNLATQKECLSILGAAQRALPGGAFGNLETDCLKFAEIIGGAVLAGEISLIAALASNDLAKAHQLFARGKQDQKSKCKDQKYK